MSTYIIPRLQTNAEQEERRVGFELEFAGLEMQKVAEILANAMNGKVNSLSHAESEVEVPGLGTFVVELDWQFAKETAKERAEQHASAKEAVAAKEADVPDDPFVEWLTRVASQVVPIEVVCPPIPVSKLHQLDLPVARLREAGALGTQESLLYAFGVHINPELPNLAPATVVRYLKAYCVCQSWLLKAHQVDPVRRITPYIDLYPGEYLAHVLAYSGEEPIEQVIDDYLRWNPTRNRALDLTPLFKFIDEARVTSKLQDPRINSRPTFHYRMPNCAIEKSDWTLALSWRNWCVIEALASDETLLEPLVTQCLAYQQKPIALEEEPWHPALEKISADL